MKGNFNSQEKLSGFTLIELLVVISIIGLLSAVVLTSLNTTRIRARDGKRAHDLRTMQTVLELYRVSNNGNVPLTASWKCSDCVAGSGSYLDAAFFTTNFITPGHISTWPTDPTLPTSRGSPTVNGYIYRSPDGINYELLIYQTVENPSSIPNLRAASPYNNSWRYCSDPGSASTCAVP